MAIVNAHMFTDESALALETHGGWDFSSTSTAQFEPTTDARDYSGSPANRHAMEMKSGAHWFDQPSWLRPSGQEGIVSMGLRCDSNVFPSGHTFLTITPSAGGGNHYLTPFGAAISVFHKNTFVGTSPAYDWRDWHWVSLFVSMSDGNNWLLKLEIDGVSVVTSSLDPDGAGLGLTATITNVRHTTMSGNSDHTYICDIVTRDTYADAAPVRYAGRVEWNDDGGTNGTWSGGFGDIDSPIDDTNFRENTSTSTGHYFTEDIDNGGSDDIADQLGTTPDVIDAVIGMAFATGDTASIDMRVSDDAFTSEDDGADVALSATVQAAVVVSTTTPSGGGAWAGSDNISGRVQVTA